MNTKVIVKSYVRPLGKLNFMELNYVSIICKDIKLNVLQYFRYIIKFVEEKESELQTVIFFNYLRSRKMLKFHL